jgi:hypothetical protein
MRLRVALAVLIACPVSAFAADAITYKGTLGKISIVAELVEPGEDGSFLGRYAYLSKGGDIPLHGRAEAKGKLAIDEEAPCTPALCMTANDEVAEKAPIGANWTLASDPDGATLKGEWKDVKSGKTLPIVLKRVASRTLSGDYSGFDSLDPSFVSGDDDADAPSSDTLPYDFLKMNVPLKPGKEATLGDGSFRFDTDSRTGIAYPVLSKLAGGDVDKANAYLTQQRFRVSLEAFSCVAKAYLGLGWFGSDGEGSYGFSDGLDVKVNLLTPRLIGITESGSYWCGGAHPDNFQTYRLADLATNKPIVAETFLKDWVARDLDGNIVDPATVEDKDSITYGAGDELIALVNKKRQRLDDANETDCGIDELVRSNLGVYFTQTDMVFTLKDLPHVIFACTADLMTVPLKDARPFLTAEGAKYLGLPE